MPTSDTEAPGDEHAPPLLARVEGVLLDPVETFRKLEPSWGLAGPIVLIALAGLVAALVFLALIDVSAVKKAESAYSFELLPEQVRRMQVETAGKGGTDTADMGARYGAFAVKVAVFAGPTLGTVLSVVVMGMLLFVVSLVSGGKRDLLLAMVIAAHAKLVALVGTAAFLMGTVIMRNPEPQTNLMNTVDRLAHPGLAMFLAGLDPIAIWHTVLLSIGLAVSLGVSRRRAVAFGVVLHLIPWLVCMGGALTQWPSRAE